ncbi:hypothetical protein LOTGIDRAFT_163186 [Lottia gigantea]|uniref:Uncharacterized protein n=1 Tax=Lottia gigantea TaxID=225164 RepID=V4BSC2_LOTGI|nr:hypothetical protein LOTGIDRAFT_163186 [Lottia gigantea]ESO91824.1 hypothetical protein LOTGIDRAFT_163186 [Lottia gigantea]
MPTEAMDDDNTNLDLIPNNVDTPSSNRTTGFNYRYGESSSQHADGHNVDSTGVSWQDTEGDYPASKVRSCSDQLGINVSQINKQTRLSPIGIIQKSDVIPKTVLIVGSSLVNHAVMAARQSSHGLNMGLNAKVWWQGTSALRWI